ncbi:putative permease family protein [Monocercomonoides exilis]|uniref:putative permease family protein n=1 Tax=Monocercomonoides exilis TaxID=2049356 RepID=UPI003559C330|nr:putative permease family protein [Monocercomonoides exilis]|eukprot:MONOS_7580.1-p1 / transcript=MONOS_7580.1 / gene=MONOS_7580 / organism=Monocercomonoides_exilis_PA203 / gene_product=FtsX domain-containing protein / transcript_product=FtsX domain-containing protein / location=Mono_scaffold00262:33416-36661(+) / protein_length=1008 / sequence_SO=supercontig / SO=protein_coding / is_pseudo=false
MIKFSEVDKMLKNDPDVLGISTRFQIPGICNPPNQMNGKDDSCVLFAQETTKEKEIGIGRNWKHRALNKGECHASNTLLNKYNYTAGDMISFGFGEDSILTAILMPLIESQPSLPVPKELILLALKQFEKKGKVSFTLVDGISDRAGKYISMGNVVLIEKEHLMFALAEGMYEVMKSQPPPLGDYAEKIRDAVAGIDISEYWVQIVGNFKNRMDIYTKKEEQTSLEIKTKADGIYDALGVGSPLTVMMSTYTAMQATNTMRTFLDQMFLSTIIILVGLGALLIYTLMLSDVEEKTYEFGMIRAIGMTTKELVLLLTTQSQLYAIPGTIVGIGMSVIALLIAVKVVGNIVHYNMPLFYEGGAVALTVCLGLLMPVAANFYPIHRAITRTLRDSLDLYHQLNSETQVTFTNLQTMGISFSAIVMALVVVALGFMLFYGLPSSFFSGDIATVLFLFIWVLLAMLLGLILIAVFFEPYFERLLVYVFVCCGDKRFRGLVRKSLSSHRNRNRKTAIMFTASLAFVIFVGSEFALQSKQIVDQIKVGYGSDLVFTAPSIAKAHNPDSLAIALQNTLSIPGSPVSGYSYSTFPLTAQKTISNVMIGNLNALDSRYVNLIAVDDHFLSGTYSEFYSPDAFTSSISFPTSHVDTASSRGGGRKKDVYLSLAEQQRNVKLPIEEKIPNGAISILTGPKTYEIQENTSPDGQNTSNRDFPKKIQKNATTLYKEYIDVVVSTGLLAGIHADVKTPMNIEVRLSHAKSSATTSLSFLAKARASLSKTSGLSFGAFSSSAAGSSVVVPKSQMMELLHDCLITTEQVESEEDFKKFQLPIQNAYVRLNEKVTEAQRSQVKDTVLAGIDSDTSITDVTEMVATIEDTVVVLDIFYIVFGVIAIVLCFFVLWISFTANVRENGWEFGVLRSIGLTGWQTVRIYIYEALILVASCIIFGSVIGIGLAIILTVQMTMFSEMPFQYHFPAPLFGVTIFLSVAVAIFGSILAARDMKNKDIAIVIRSGA